MGECNVIFLAIFIFVAFSFTRFFVSYIGICILSSLLFSAASILVLRFTGNCLCELIYGYGVWGIDSVSIMYILMRV